MSIEELERRFEQIQMERFDPDKVLQLVTNVNESLRPMSRPHHKYKPNKRLTTLKQSVNRFINDLPKYHKNKFDPHVAIMNRKLSRYGRGRTARISTKALSMIRNLNRNASRSRVSRRRASRWNAYDRHAWSSAVDRTFSK